MSEVQDAMQIFAVTIQGIEVSFRIAKEMLEIAQKLVMFLSNMLFQEKLLGKTSMKTLIRQGTELEACQIPADRMKEFEKNAKKYGILYTVVPGEKGGLSDVLFRREDIPKMNLLFEKMGLGKVDSKDIMDYVNDLPEERIHDIAPENKEVYPSQGNERKKVEGIQGTERVRIGTSKEIFDDATMEKMQGIYHEAQELILDARQNGMGQAEFDHAIKNLQMKALSSHPGYEEISIATRNKLGKLLLMDESREMVKVRIPYQKDKYVWLDKKEAFLSEDKKKITAFMKRDRNYDIVDGQNRKVESMKGSELRKRHFDPVGRKQGNKSKTQERQQTRNQQQTRRAKAK